MPGGLALLRSIFGGMFGPAGRAPGTEPLSAEETSIGRQFQAGVLADKIGQEQHPDRPCEPGDACQKLASGLLWGRWLAETGRLTDVICPLTGDWLSERSEVRR